MTVVEAVKEWWGWAGISPVAIVGENQFGNLLIQDTEGKYWRLCPDEAYCKIVARDRSEFDLLFKDIEFLEGWYMTAAVCIARQTLGALPYGMKYCLKVPILLGGSCEAGNVQMSSLIELVVISGEISRNLQGVLESKDIKH